jgi:hypothetical protein
LDQICMTKLLRGISYGFRMRAREARAGPTPPGKARPGDELKEKSQAYGDIRAGI